MFLEAFVNTPQDFDRISGKIACDRNLKSFKAWNKKRQASEPFYKYLSARPRIRRISGVSYRNGCVCLETLVCHAARAEDGGLPAGKPRYS